MQNDQSKKKETNGKNYEFQSNLWMDENLKHTKVTQYLS